MMKDGVIKSRRNASYSFELCCDQQRNVQGVLAVSVDLRVSRIYRHLAASPSFGGQVGGAGGMPRLR